MGPPLQPMEVVVKHAPPAEWFGGDEEMAFINRQLMCQKILDKQLIIFTMTNTAFRNGRSSAERIQTWPKAAVCMYFKDLC